MSQEEIQKRLLIHQVKPSVQRIAIMGYLMEHRTHPTADMIFNDLYNFIPTLSRTTVYNTLKLLVDQGAVQMLTIDEKNLRYDADISQHAHFKCRGCGCIYDLPIEQRDRIIIAGVGELMIDEIQVYCKGYCKECFASVKQQNIDN